MYRTLFFGLLLLSIACKRGDSVEVIEESEPLCYELNLRFEEINSLSNSKTCTDSSIWEYTAYGSKACGGPQGYIAYSTELDVADFLQKVKEYTELEEEYNRKTGIVSTCILPAEPSDVACKSGEPAFLY